MMILLAHETFEDALESACVLNALGPYARKLLAACVETTGATRKQLSKAAKDLESAGFLFIREPDDPWNGEFYLKPTLAGEEALEILDEN